MSHSVDSSPKIGSKFRCNNSSKSLKDNHQILRGKLSKCHISKSACELQSRGGGRRSSVEEKAAQTENDPKVGMTLPQQDVLARHATVVQKTQAFFSSLKVGKTSALDNLLAGLGMSRRDLKAMSKSEVTALLGEVALKYHERLSKSRNRDRSQKPDRDDAVVCRDESPGRKKFYRWYTQESNHSAGDNSSEHSNSATPQMQSPFHETKQKTSSSPSRKFQKSKNLTQSLDMNAENEQTDISDKMMFQDCINGTNNRDGNDNITDSPFLLMNSQTSRISEQVKSMPEVSTHETLLRQHSFFLLQIHLKCGKDLIAKDKNGLSDPYVKFKISGKLMYKSKIIYRDLNPVWDENFTLPIEDPFVPVQIKVFDYDWGLQDDFIGSAYLHMTRMDLGKSYDLTFTLEDTKGSENLGEIHLTATLLPRTQLDREQYYQKNVKTLDATKRLKNQIWSSVVTIVLIKGVNLIAMDSDGYSDPYVKFRLGNEKYKSKVAYKTLNPSWLEQFDLHLYEDQSQELEITVWDKDWTIDDFMGRCTVPLDSLERERTHKITKELEEGCGTISLLLTISGTTASETISDLTTYEENPKEIESIQRRYVLRRTFHNLKDIGFLTVKIYKAQGLAAADICGKSDPFCVVELINARLQTQTEYKTLTPSWQKIFTFNVKDVHSVLEVTVYDEDKDHKVEFLGKVAIPLLRIHNNEKRWYALKDKKLRCRAKGNSPQILLEMNMVWNVLRACIRTLNPKEEKYMQGEMKFKRQLFVQNVMRLKNIVMYFIELSKFVQSCFEWESYIQSMIAFILFILLCHYAEPYMLPIGLLLIFFACYIIQKVTNTSNPSKNVTEEDEEVTGDDDDDDDDDKDGKEEKKSLKERLQAIQEVTQTVQNSIGYIASLCESVKNTFNFTVPFLSYLAIILLIAATFILYWIPVRYLIMIWGINKFSRKLIRPNTIPNNELLDFLSRVPDDEDLISYRELKPTHPNNESSARRTKKSKIPS